MYRAKETIQKSFGRNKEKHKDIFTIIDKRWECQLHNPLHVARHYLDPKFFYKNSTTEFYVEIIYGLYQHITRLVLSTKV